MIQSTPLQRCIIGVEIFQRLQNMVPLPQYLINWC